MWTVDSGRYHSRAHVHNTTTTPSHGAGARAGAADREGVSAYTAACRHQGVEVTILQQESAVAAAVRGSGPMEARHRAAAAAGGLTGHRSNPDWELELPTNLLEVGFPI